VEGFNSDGIKYTRVWSNVILPQDVCNINGQFAQDMISQENLQEWEG